MLKFKKPFPSYKQFDNTDCGPTCLKMVAKFYGKMYPTEYLREICYITNEGVSVMGIVDAAEEIGFKSLVIKSTYDTLAKKAPLPCIIHWRQRHFVVVYKIDKNYVHIADPEYGLTKYKKAEFIEAWQNTRYLNNDDEGLVILLEPSNEFYTQDVVKEKKTGFHVLIPYFKQYKKYYFQLIIGLVIGSIIQLILPFLTQAIVDKGINYKDINFISLILIAQISLFFSQSVITILRSWLLLFIGSRINISIATDFLSRLLKLPISFFDSRISGDVIQRVQDSNRIEAFLATSPNTLFSVINMIIFLFVLLFFNTTISVIFLIGALFYISWVVFFMKRRAKLEHRRFDESSGNSSSLLQIVNGIQEIKINGSEKRRKWGWEEVRIKLFRISVEVLKVNQIQTIGATSINEIKNILISYTAAYAVIKGEMTLGTMLAIQYIVGQLRPQAKNGTKNTIAITSL